MVMPYHLHMPSYFLETFTEYPFLTLARLVLEAYIHIYTYIRLLGYRLLTGRL